MRSWDLDVIKHWLQYYQNIMHPNRFSILSWPSLLALTWVVAAAHSLPVGEKRMLDVSTVCRVERDPSPPVFLPFAPGSVLYELCSSSESPTGRFCIATPSTNWSDLKSSNTPSSDLQVFRRKRKITGNEKWDENNAKEEEIARLKIEKIDWFGVREGGYRLNNMRWHGIVLAQMELQCNRNIISDLLWDSWNFFTRAPEATE